METIGNVAMRISTGSMFFSSTICSDIVKCSGQNSVANLRRRGDACHDKAIVTGFVAAQSTNGIIIGSPTLEYAPSVAFRTNYRINLIFICR